MRTPPPIADAAQYPFVAALALGAIAATGVVMVTPESPLALWFYEDGRVRQGHLWLFFASMLAHGGLIHLAFNLYWWWTFGTLIERKVGSLRLAGLTATLALTSGAAEFALFSGGYGLSGVVYGVFGLLWGLRGHDSPIGRQAIRTIDQNTVVLFVGWMLLGVVLTYTDVFPMGNAAHAGGLVTGLALGFTARAGAVQVGAVATGLVIASAVLAIITRPWVNLEPDSSWIEWDLGYEAYQRGDHASSARWYQDAVRIDPTNADLWYNLFYARDELGRHDLARSAYERAVELDPSFADEP